MCSRLDGIFKQASFGWSGAHSCMKISNLIACMSISLRPHKPYRIDHDL
jgi:hypothetical protein